MTRTPRVGDAAVAPLVGSLILVAVAVTSAAALYTALHALAPDPVPPAAVALSASEASSPGIRTMTIASASGGLRWDRLGLNLDGAPLTYDAALAGPGTYCVVASSTACVPTADFPADARVGAGQEVRVLAAAPAGRQVRVVDLEANVILAEIRLA